MILANFRNMFEKQHSQDEHKSFRRDVGDALTFMKSHRVHKELLERYNPLHDLTSQERIKATARRVGLDMPVEPSKE